MISYCKCCVLGQTVQWAIKTDKNDCLLLKIICLFTCLILKYFEISGRLKITNGILEHKIVSIHYEIKEGLVSIQKVVLGKTKPFLLCVCGLYKTFVLF